MKARTLTNATKRGLVQTSDAAWSNIDGERTLDPLHASRGLIIGLIVAAMLWIAIGMVAHIV